jgi:hypothetical protein
MNLIVLFSFIIVFLLDVIELILASNFQKSQNDMVEKLNMNDEIDVDKRNN